MKAGFARVAAVASALWIAFAGEGLAKDVQVVFLNPGQVGRDAGWTQRAVFMQAAADQFGIRLEVLYADRDRLKMVDQAKAVAARTHPPDYVVLVNEKQQAAEIMDVFRGSSSKLLLMHNDLTAEQRRHVGNERARLSNWIGSIVTDERAGARALIAELYRRTITSPKVLGIGGDDATPVSWEREDGVRSFMAEAGRGEMLQVVPGDWTREDSREKALGLLARYPDATVLWAANDSMALGAQDAVVAMKRQGTVLVGGIGGFPNAVDSVASGGLAVSVGGNGLLGAWVMVLIHDYERGRDFAPLGLRLEAHTVVVVASAEAATRFKALIDNPSSIDFRRFSRADNPLLRNYDFSYDAVLAATE